MHFATVSGVRSVDLECPWRAETLHEDWPVRGVPIPDEVSRRIVPRESLGDLARDPLRGRICCHAKRYPKSSSVSYNNKTIENLECDRRQDKKVDRCDAVGMVAEKRPPAPRWWQPAAAHIPSDRRLGDLEAELEQFPCGQNIGLRLLSLRSRI